MDTESPQMQLTGREASLANLRPAPQFPPGTSGNPGGRPKGVVYPAEWIRGPLSDLTTSQLRAVAGDQVAPLNKRAAASIMLRALEGQSDLACDRALAEVMDRTTGKSVQQVNVTAAPAAPDAAALLGEVRQSLQLTRRAPAQLEGDPPA